MYPLRSALSAYPQADSADADFMSCGAERILIINPSLRSGADIKKLLKSIENRVFKGLYMFNSQKFSALRAVLNILLYLFVLWHVYEVI